VSSKTQICNLALTQIGAQRIISLDDGTEVATVCSVLFDDISDEVISMGPWTSCVFRANLAALATTPLFEFAYEFQLPEDPFCLRVLGVDCPTSEYRIEGRKILSDQSELNIKYIGRPSDPSQYDQMLKRAVTARLKMELAYAFSGQISVQQAAEQAFKDALRYGLGVDGKQGSSERIKLNPLKDVR
jgi:hypothetical protein